MLGFLLFLLLFINTLSPSYGSEALQVEPLQASEVTIICREIESTHCALGWLVQLVEGVYLKADSAEIQPESWAQGRSGRFTIPGTILAYSSNLQSWRSQSAVFLACQNPTSSTASSLSQSTTYLDCDHAVYAFRRVEKEDGYICLRFFFANRPRELFWGCFNESPVSARMTDLSIHDGLQQKLESPYVALAWTLTVQNERVFHVDASDVRVTVHLLLGARLQSATPSQGSCQPMVEGTVVCSLGLLRSANTATVEIALTVDPNVHSGTFSITASVRDYGETFDPLLDNNTSSGSATVESSAFLVSPSCVAPGDSFTLSDLTLDLAALGPDGVHIGDRAANILAASSTGLVLEMPSLPDGVVGVAVEGAAGSASVTVAAACSVRQPSIEDVQAGFVAGEVLIFLKPGLSLQEIERFKSEYGFTSLVEYPALGFYRAVLGDKPLKSVQEEQSPVSCRINKRNSAPDVDLLLLVDLSGTMDEARLKPLLVELSHQMYCLLSRGSRVSVMAYNNEPKLELAFAPWSRTQYEALYQWLEEPLLPGNKSHLEEALATALEVFQSSARPDVSKHLLAITRGPALPPVKDAQALIARAQQEGVTIQGLGMLGSFFSSRSYEDLRSIAQATGRDLLFWEEHQRWAISSVATRALVQGVYGITGCKLEDCLTQIPTTHVNLSQETEGVIGLLNRDPRVEQAFFNDLVDTLQSDPRIGDQDWLLKLGLPQGWDDFFPHRGAGVTIAVIDTGADLRLTQSASAELVLSSLAPEGLNFAPVPAELKHPLGQDDLGHGTAVSTIAAASIGNELNGAGVAPRATLIPMKVFAVVGGAVKASNEAVAQALMSAFSLGVDVINMSLGCQGCSSTTESALRKYYERVINNLLQKANQSKGKVPVIVAASGNDGEPRIDSPAAHPFVFAVGSIKPDFSGRSDFSNYGPELDFVAMGEEIETTVAGGGFTDAGSGTSFASPQVAGLVALILGEEPGLSPDGVRARIRQCFIVDVGKPDFDEEMGWGRIWIPPLSQAKPECVRKR